MPRLHTRCYPRPYHRAERASTPRHSGIIENYVAVKKLIEEGHKFSTETDSDDPKSGGNGPSLIALGVGPICFRTCVSELSTGGSALRTNSPSESKGNIPLQSVEIGRFIMPAFAKLSSGSMFVHWSRSRICSNSLRRTIVIALLVSSVLLVSHANAQNSDFTIVLLPDTQYYSQSYPQTFSAQAQWIANNAAALNTQLVIGLGDVVQSPGSASEWQNADAAVRTLDAAGIPYVIAIGNHDYDGNNPGGRTATMYNQYFGPPRYANYSWYKGQYPAGSNENFYAIVTVNSKQYLILVLELFPRDSALNWANSVLQANPSAEVIVVTHAHVYNDNSRIARCDDSSVDQLGVLNDNDGQRLWSKFLKQYSNISLVLNGHSNFTLGGIGNEGAARRADLGINGNLVNQMLSDYQEGPSGGNGYLRILTFHPSADTIDVTTYSPTLNSYYAGSLDKFTINWHTAGAQTPGAGTISGRIRSASSCASLPGITVSAGGASVVTDSNGRYSLSVSAPGTYTVTAQGNSAHLPQSGSIEVYPQYPASLKMTMDDAGSIAGRVVDGGGTPVQGASIAYTGGNIATNGTAITDGNGNYTTPPMSVGTYSLTASASGLPSSSQTATVNAASTTTINFALIPPGNITGTVTNTAGAPIAGANISGTAGSAVTDSTGTFTLWNLGPGTYTLNYVANGFTTVSQSLMVSSGATTSANATLKRMIAINAGGPAYTDARGQTWQADAYYNTGGTSSTTANVAGTTDPTLLKTERYNSMTSDLVYNIPVANGNYNVTLYFAEIASVCFTTGCRVFNVSLQGTSVLQNLDVYATAGANAALSRSFPVTVTNGAVIIDFQTVVRYPIINAIQIGEQ